MLTFFTVLEQESAEKTNTQQLFNTIFMKIAEYNNSNCSKFNTAAKQLHFDNFHRSITGQLYQCLDSSEHCLDQCPLVVGNFQCASMKLLPGRQTTAMAVIHYLFI